MLLAVARQHASVPRRLALRRGRALGLRPADAPAARALSPADRERHRPDRHRRGEREGVPRADRALAPAFREDLPRPRARQAPRRGRRLRLARALVRRPGPRRRPRHDDRAGRAEARDHPGLRAARERRERAGADSRRTTGNIWSSPTTSASTGSCATRTASRGASATALSGTTRAGAADARGPDAAPRSASPCRRVTSTTASARSVRYVPMQDVIRVATRRVKSSG